MNWISIGLMLVLIWCVGCEPSGETVEPEVVLEHDGAWHDLYWTDNDEIIAVGGQSWYRGDVAWSDDGGASWRVDSVTSKAMYGVAVRGSDRIAVGIDGQLMQGENGIEWRKWRVPYWRVLLDVGLHPEEDYFIAVGGKRFKNGVIQVVSLPDFKVVLYDTLENGLEAVHHVAGDRWVAAGYGRVLTSEDGGLHWQQQIPAQAYFTTLYFESSGKGWMASQYGGLWRSDNGGQQWIELRAPKTTFSTRGFRDLTRDEEGVLWLAGDQGTLAYSKNEGKDLHFLMIKGEPDIRALVVKNNQILLATRSGELLRLPYPEDL